MSEMGLGTMIAQMSDKSQTVRAIQKSLNKKMIDLWIDKDSEPNKLKIKFEDNSILSIFDEGQSCCEHRFMTTDDDLRDYIGQIFKNIEVKEGSEIEVEGETKETEFVEITTDKGHFQIVNHNHHNGYYGGFCVGCSLHEEK